MWRANARLCLEQNENEVRRYWTCTAKQTQAHAIYAADKYDAKLGIALRGLKDACATGQLPLRDLGGTRTHKQVLSYCRRTLQQVLFVYLLITNDSSPPYMQQRVAMLWARWGNDFAHNALTACHIHICCLHARYVSDCSNLAAELRRKVPGGHQ